MALHLVIALNFLLFVSMNAARVVITLYALQLGASTSAAGVAIAMFYLFPLLFSWPVGVLSDRFRARWLLLIGATCGAAGMLLPYFWATYAALCAAAAMMGMVITFAGVLGPYLVGLLSTPETRTRNFSNFSLSGALCGLFGPLFAGFQIDHFGPAITCLSVAGLSMLGILSLVFFGGRLPVPAQGTRAGGRGSGSLLTTLADRRLWPVLAISSLAQLAFDVFQAFIPIQGHAIGLSASVIGVVLAAFAAGSFGVRIVMTKLIDRFGETRLLSGAFCLGAASFALVPFAHGEPLLITAGVLFGMAIGCTQPLTMMLMYASAEEGRAGEALGLRMTVNNVWRLAGPALFGALAAVASIGAVFWVNAGLMVWGARLSGRERAKTGTTGTTGTTENTGTTGNTD